jgi:hypothetical protein
LSISDCYYLVSTIKLALYLAFEPTTGEQSGALVRIETCVREIDSWMVSNKLKLSGDKTELLVINACNRSCPPIHHIDVSNFKIQPFDTSSNIGVTIDRHMSLDQNKKQKIKIEICGKGT